MTDSSVIQLRDVELSFDDRTILDGIDLDVEKGQTLCILGGSGAGKSTILRLILGLTYADRGRILVDGHDIAAASTSEVLALRRRIGMVFQGGALFDSLSVYDNVAFSLHEHTDLPETEIEARVHEALAFVDLDPEIVRDQVPAELSGGMIKRVGVARAIIHRPDILLFDEPTSGLDPITTRTVDDLILKLQRELKVTTVVVTHDIASALLIADRLALLAGGDIVFNGTAEQMMASALPYVQDFLT